ncbi:MAG: ornithine cyclodeaminase family protein [Marinobacterium sp.]|nr:ornithine cyclodeaminase family protein [Marinobacterium sp.]
MQLDADQLRQSLPWPALIDAIGTMFTADVQAPLRHHHTMQVPGEAEATLLLMPAWLEGRYLGVKQVTVFPDNNRRGLPGVNARYSLSCGRTGQPLAQLDGNELTTRRTAAASALAAGYLCREDAHTLLMVGSGRMARRLIPAHLSVRPLQEVLVWDRKETNAARLVTELQQQGIAAQVCLPDQLEQGVRRADLISCATMATQPLIRGEWLQPGCHLDLVGSFTPTMREVDNQAMQKAAIFVDTRRGALVESGELLIPIREGAISADDVVAEFAELCADRHPGRSALAEPDKAITLFKSVGDSLEDLAAAILAYEHNRDNSTASSC